MPDADAILIYGAREHNLRSIDVRIPRGVLTVVTGISGSGKSSLAFDTIYAEGQRRYVESLSTSARQFLEQMQKPRVDRIEGLSPTIAIDQRLATASPRSIVATTTEIYDFLRVLFARVGRPSCPVCDRPITRQSTAEIVDAVLDGADQRRVLVLAPVVRRQRGAHKDLRERMIREGFVRARVDGVVTMLEDVGELSPTRAHSIEIVVDRLITKPGLAQRLADSVETATRLSDGAVIVAFEIEPGRFEDRVFSAVLTCPEHPESRIDDLAPRLLSFNSPHGACADCRGLGTTIDFDPELVVPDPDRSIAEGAVVAWRNMGQRLTSEHARRLQEFCEDFKVPPDMPFRDISEKKRDILLRGSIDADGGATFVGVIPDLQARFQSTDSESLKKRLLGYQYEKPCLSCAGTRLQPQALCVKIEGRHIAQITAMTIAEALAFFVETKFEGESQVVAEPLVREIVDRLRFMCDVGVEYLSLDRPSTTLSGGEAQRIRLATQIGSNLAGVCYVLDEPTIGLHPRDTSRLADLLARLTDGGNTVIVVEHDEQIIARAAYLVDIGPGAGEQGGRLVAQGSLENLLATEDSITAKYLTGERAVEVPEQRRNVDPKRIIEIRGARANNLKNVTARIPLGCLVCVTGVSGSGKSTLVTDVLLRALKRLINRSGPRPGAHDKIIGADAVDRVIEIDQAPIGRTPRSNPATYVGVFDLIRQLYAKTREAKIRGYGANRFSFNVKGGRCEHCQGQGTKRIEMHFLPDVYVTCEACRGSRYNRETLEVRYRGKSIADILDMRVSEAVDFFDNFANIRRRLSAMKDVGLGYLTLGQSSSTLSGGEAQRIKLASELGKAVEGHVMYILDEPTTGLHFADVHALLTVLNRLADRGHSVVVIEHNLDVIKVADWIIDLGPEGGDGGGQIIAEGTPEQIAVISASHTGQYLKGRLSGKPPLVDSPPTCGR